MWPRGSRCRVTTPSCKDPGNSKVPLDCGRIQNEGPLTSGPGTRVWLHHARGPWKARSLAHPGKSWFSSAVFESAGMLRVITQRKVSSFFCGSYRKRKKLSFKKQATSTTVPPPTDSQHTDLSAHLTSTAAHVSYSYSVSLLNHV